MLDTHWLLQLQAVAQVALAGLLGGVIGLERELARKPAGLRTHIFVCAAAALFMALGQNLIAGFSTEASDAASQTSRAIRADPIRVMQSVVLGISFLGAGTIIRHGRDRIEGLTTAASILLVAGIGIAVATGELVTAVCVTVLTLLVLVVVGWIERRIFRRHTS